MIPLLNVRIIEVSYLSRFYVCFNNILYFTSFCLHCCHWILRCFFIPSNQLFRRIMMKSTGNLAFLPNIALNGEYLVDSWMAVLDALTTSLSISSNWLCFSCTYFANEFTRYSLIVSFIEPIGLWRIRSGHFMLNAKHWHQFCIELVMKHPTLISNNHWRYRVP